MYETHLESRTSGRGATSAARVPGYSHEATLVDSTLVVTTGRRIDIGILRVIHAATRDRREDIREILLDLTGVAPELAADIDVMIAIDAYYAHELGIFVLAEHNGSPALSVARARCPHIIWLD